MEIKGVITSTEANRHFSKVVESVQEFGVSAITKNNKPLYVIMTYEKYLEMDKRRLKDYFLDAVASEHGKWVMLTDYIANNYNRNETTKSEREHPARIRIIGGRNERDPERIELLEIIDDMPRVYTFLTEKVSINEYAGRLSIRTYSKPTWVKKYESSIEREDFIDKLYASIGLTAEIVKQATSQPLKKMFIIRYL